MSSRIGSAAGSTDYKGHGMYDQMLSYRDFEQILLALGASGSDVRRLWPFGHHSDVASRGMDVRVKTDAPHTSRRGQRAIVEDEEMTGKGRKFKLRFEDGDWGWYSEKEVVRVSVW